MWKNYTQPQQDFWKNALAFTLCFFSSYWRLKASTKHSNDKINKGKRKQNKINKLDIIFEVSVLCSLNIQIIWMIHGRKKALHIQKKLLPSGLIVLGQVMLLTLTWKLILYSLYIKHIELKIGLQCCTTTLCTYKTEIIKNKYRATSLFLILVRLTNTARTRRMQHMFEKTGSLCVTVLTMYFVCIVLLKSCPWQIL